MVESFNSPFGNSLTSGNIRSRNVFLSKHEYSSAVKFRPSVISFRIANVKIYRRSPNALPLPVPEVGDLETLMFIQTIGFVQELQLSLLPLQEFCNHINLHEVISARPSQLPPEQLTAGISRTMERVIEKNTIICSAAFSPKRASVAFWKTNLALPLRVIV